MLFCEYCGCVHKGEYASGRFCSSRCARGFSTKEKRKEINKKVSIALGGTGLPKENKTDVSKKTKSSKFCVLCGKLLEEHYHKRLQRKFCDYKCFRSYCDIRKDIDIESSGGIGYGHRPLKSYLIRKFGNVCSICNGSTWMGHPMPLVLDHIDGRAYNNSLYNIRLVCGNCDMQLPTYKSKNKNSDRKRRRVV